ncbi:MAG: CT583 family protein [Parachlamydiaceae bacterium]|nr:CT583 family protein [Parachlamydiaceae bacterium]
MARINSILDERMKKSSNTAKMSAMASQSAAGHLTTFSGLFSVSDLSEKEKTSISSILEKYANDDQNIESDLNHLISITSEVKAINHQAALLHGERIKKAHKILIAYKEGAFTAWLMATYGNRQTPYNLMQYFEFCEAMPKQLRPQIESMPRQAVYVLASRDGAWEIKQNIVKEYSGENKAEMLEKIRRLFPLDMQDKRQQRPGRLVLDHLERLFHQVDRSIDQLSSKEKKQIRLLLENIQQLLE